MIPPYDSLSWQIESLARDMADQHPDVQRIRQECTAKITAALATCRDEGQRQNARKTAQAPMPPIRVEANPLGAQRKGK